MEIKIILFNFMLSSVCANGNWEDQPTMEKCPGDEIMTKFRLKDSNPSLANLSSVTWYYNISVDPATVVCYFSHQNGLKFTEDKYRNRVEMLPNSYNIKIKNLTSADTGYYDITFSILEGSNKNTRGTNGTLHLSVNDPCVKVKEAKDGCTEMTCSTSRTNPVYSWEGDGASGKTTAVVEVCPKEKTEYKCCVDSQKSACMMFQADAAKDNGNGGNGSSSTTVIVIVIVLVVVIAVAVLIGLYIFWRRRRGANTSANASPNLNDEREEERKEMI